MRLIDADELKEVAHEMIQEDPEAFNGGYSYNAVTVEEIDEAPTIEAVPVVQAESIRKEAVEDFAKWCYINGIDFSYMHKATDTEPFCKMVLKRYEEEQGKKV